MDKSDVGSVAHIERLVGFPLLASGMIQPSPWHGIARVSRKSFHG